MCIYPRFTELHIVLVEMTKREDRDINSDDTSGIAGAGAGWINREMKRIPKSDIDDNQKTNSTSKHSEDYASNEVELAREEFLKAHEKGWYHKVKVPYTFFEYQNSKDTSVDNTYGGVYNQNIFIPRAVLRPIDSDSETNNKNESLTDDELVKYEDILRKSDGVNFFTGYHSMPRLSLRASTKAGKFLGSEENKLQCPNICYPSHVEIDDITYIFGGLCLEKKNDFGHLGIPKDVTVDKISIHFPCELPPHVDKEILTSPFMTPFNFLLLFEIEKSSVVYLNPDILGEFPHALCNSQGCKISNTHAFFFGGFEIHTLSVEYKDNIDRWIIKRDITMNKYGYILDVKTLKFIRIELKSIGEVDFSIERIGHAIASTFFSNDYKYHLSNPMSSPPNENIIADNLLGEDKAALLENEVPYGKADHETEASLPTMNNDQMPIATRTESEVSDLSSLSGLNVDDSKLSNADLLYHPHRAQKHTKNKLEPVETKAVKVDSISSKRSSRHAAPKFSHVLSKSNRIFHRHLKEDGGNSKVIKDTSIDSENYKRPIPHRVESPLLDDRARGSLSPKKHHNSKISRDVESPLSVKLSDTSTLAKSTISDDKVDLLRPEDFLEKEYLEHKKTKKFLLNSTEFIENLNQESGFRCPGTQQKVKDIFFETSNEGVCITMYIFGGFTAFTDSNGFKYFKATKDLLQIDLRCTYNNFSLNFERTASVNILGEGFNPLKLEKDYPSLWPSARGYFAYSLIDNLSKDSEDSCFIINTANKDNALLVSILSQEGDTSGLIGTFSSIEDLENPRPADPKEFLMGKALLVHGGCDENYETFSDFYVFVFKTGTWYTMSTFGYDYFGFEKNPDEDDDASKFSKDCELAEATMVEAELRACHHQAIYFKNDERHYLYFVCGFYNDYLRFFDKVPYKSDKFDVSRLAKYLYSTDTPNVVRVLMLDLRTQIWRLFRYYYDISHLCDVDFMKTMNSKHWRNARICPYGGTVSLNGKKINIFQGMVIPVPEKKAYLEDMKKDLPGLHCLLGANARFTFPFL